MSDQPDVEHIELRSRDAAEVAFDAAMQITERDQQLAAIRDWLYLPRDATHTEVRQQISILYAERRDVRAALKELKAALRNLDTAQRGPS